MRGWNTRHWLRTLGFLVWSDYFVVHALSTYRLIAVNRRSPQSMLKMIARLWCWNRVYEILVGHNIRKTIILGFSAIEDLSSIRIPNYAFCYSYNLRCKERSLRFAAAWEFLSIDCCRSTVFSARQGPVVFVSITSLADFFSMRHSIKTPTRTLAVFSE